MDAGVDQICTLLACGVERCHSKCKTDTDCPSNPLRAFACEIESGRCRAKPCVQKADCPSNYICSADKACVVQPCLTDGDCAGYCIHGACSASIGECRTILP